MLQVHAVSPKLLDLTKELQFFKENWNEMKQTIINECKQLNLP